MAKLNRIDSLESYPMDQRLFMEISLSKQTLSMYKEGREASDTEVGNALWVYHHALNNAEAQIKELLELVKEQELEDDQMENYLENYPDTDTSYHLQEAKAILFQSMAKGDEKSIGIHVNKVLMLSEKEVQNG